MISSEIRRSYSIIGDDFFGVDTVRPIVSVIGDRDGAEALARGFRVTYTPCNYGGRRAWLVCAQCGRRRLRLYFKMGWCRECGVLGYWSRLRCSSRLAAFARRAERIRERLGGPPNLTAPFPRRPRGMHRSTYRQLRDEARALEWLSAEAAVLRSWLDDLRGAIGIFPERRLYRGWLAEMRAMPLEQVMERWRGSRPAHRRSAQR